MSNRETVRRTTTKPDISVAGILQRKCGSCGQHTVAGGGCSDCEKKKGMLQRRASSSEATNEVPAIVNEVLRSPGQPLDTTTRAFMEPRFGHDFSRVRVHTDAGAQASARATNALAYTVGRDVVFGAGQYAPETKAGRELIAHELAHVVQQSRATLSVQGSLVDPPDSADEREAESVGQKVVAGEPFTAPRAMPATRLQRKILNKVETNFQSYAKGAGACVVHLHGEEHTALAVAKEIRNRRCVNLVHLDTYTNPSALQRYVRFEIDVAGKKHVCAADPNRVFTEAGLKKDALADKGCHLEKDQSKRTDGQTDVKDKAVDELRTFVSTEWGSKISECRAGSGSSPTDGALPVLALHNNEEHVVDGKKIPLLDSYKGVAEKGSRLPQDPKDPGKKAANPLIKPGEGMNDFFLVTKPQDFTDLSSKGTVFLQADPIPASEDDGSLSVVMAQQRFINVEKTGRKKDKLIDKGNKFQAHDSVYVKNYAMAADALDQFGVPDGPCPVFVDEELELQMIEGMPNSVLRNRLRPGKSNEPTLTLSTDAPVLDRDPAPKTKPANCLFFESQSELDAERAVWGKKIGRMPMVEIINWIIGGPGGVPAGVESVVKQQRKCMTDAMAKTLTDKKMKLPSGTIITSEQRTFAKQETDIWKPKFDFTFSKAFGHITDEARKKCGTDIKATEQEWNPKNKDHEHCWKTTLTGEEREREILMTSSAPGVSRHHAGTDFDFGRPGVPKDLEAEAWTGTGDFADAYRWLARNASRYGFIQPFDTEGGPGKGYTTERWHWSYYPIAQALLEFAFSHQAEIDKALQEHWQDGGKVKPEYQFISKNWRKYLFNVENQGRF